MNTDHPEARHELIKAATFDPRQTPETDPRIIVYLKGSRQASIILNRTRGERAEFQVKRGSEVDGDEQIEIFRAVEGWFEPHAEKHPHFAQSIQLAREYYEKQFRK